MKSQAYRGHRRRGAAEIELLLSVGIFLVLLFLIKGIRNLGVARLATAYKAQEMVLHDGLEASPPMYGNSVALPMALTHGGLPNRLHMVHETKDIAVYVGDQTLPVTTIGNTSQLVAPTWTYTGYPNTADQPAIQAWFGAYTDEVRGALTTPLALSPSSPP